MTRWMLVDGTGRTWFAGLTTVSTPLRVMQPTPTCAHVLDGEVVLAVVHHYDGLPALRLVTWPLS